MTKTFLIIVLGALLLPAETHAAIRCQGRLINGSYSRLDVKNYCGEPVMVDSYTKSETVNTHKAVKRVSYENVDQWYYTNGPNKTTYVIEFEGGFVSGIRQGQDGP